MGGEQRGKRRVVHLGPRWTSWLHPEAEPHCSSSISTFTEACEYMIAALRIATKASDATSQIQLSS